MLISELAFQHLSQLVRDDQVFGKTVFLFYLFFTTSTNYLLLTSAITQAYATPLRSTAQDQEELDPSPRRITHPTRRSYPSR